jgi:hypothetical protein
VKGFSNSSVNCLKNQLCRMYHKYHEHLCCMIKSERKKLCSMYNMYHVHAPSYLCDLLTPLVRDVTNYPVRNRNDYTVPRCYKTLGLLSPTKKWAGILASTTLRLRLILKVSNVLVFLVSFSRLFQRFMITKDNSL